MSLTAVRFVVSHRLGFTCLNVSCKYPRRSLSSSTSYPVRIVEVGPRDGLQNEKTLVPTEAKIEFINRLSKTGLRTIEVTSFVSPKWIPQMADNAQVFSSIEKHSNVTYPVLIPNLKGLEAAIAVGVQEIAVMASASESFAQKNLNCSADEALNRIRALTDRCQEAGLKIRGYVSCIVGCPYEGYIKPSAVARQTEALLQLGCYEVSLGDTIGVGTPRTTQLMLDEVLKVVSADKLAIHCHDTYGQALVNIRTALDMGIRVIDSSVSGLGGCPYAKGASGNVATEDLVYMLHGMGFDTGVNLSSLISTGQYICQVLNKPSQSKVNLALHKNLTKDNKSKY